MNKVMVGFSIAACAALGGILSGCSKKDAAPAEEAASVAAPQQPAAAAEAPAPSMTEAAKAAVTDGGAEMKQMAAETEKTAMAAVEETKTEAAAMQKDQAAAMQQKATSLAEQYAPQLDMLKTGATSIKALIDKNASMLPAGVSEKYQELNTLLPQLTGLVASLKDYQGGDLANLATKAQTDFQKAKSLYAEINEMLPAGSI